MLCAIFVALCVISEPGLNSCRDPGTPAYGIPVLAEGFQVGFGLGCTFEKMDMEFEL